MSSRATSSPRARGDPATGDADADRVCDDLDFCEGDDATGNLDGDAWCADVDLCDGDNRTGDVDSDGICNDLDVCDGPGDTAGDGGECPEGVGRGGPVRDRRPRLRRPIRAGRPGST